MKLSDKFKQEFEPSIKEHLTCGNDSCFYEGRWCYHLTDDEFKKMINFLKQYD